MKKISKKLRVERIREKEIKILKEADELREKEKQLRLKEQLEIEELKELRLNELQSKKNPRRTTIKRRRNKIRKFKENKK